MKDFFVERLLNKEDFLSLRLLKKDTVLYNLIRLTTMSRYPEVTTGNEPPVRPTKSSYRHFNVVVYTKSILLHLIYLMSIWDYPSKFRTKFTTHLRTHLNPMSPISDKFTVYRKCYRVTFNRVTDLNFIIQSLSLLTILGIHLFFTLVDVWSSKTFSC